MKIGTLVKLTLVKNFKCFTFLWMTHLARGIFALRFIITDFIHMFFGTLLSIFTKSCLIMPANFFSINQNFWFLQASSTTLCNYSVSSPFLTRVSCHKLLACLKTLCSLGLLLPCSVLLVHDQRHAAKGRVQLQFCCSLNQ